MRYGFAPRFGYCQVWKKNVIISSITVNTFESLIGKGPWYCRISVRRRFGVVPSVIPEVWYPLFKCSITKVYGPAAQPPPTIKLISQYVIQHEIECLWNQTTKTLVIYHTLSCQIIFCRNVTKILLWSWSGYIHMYYVWLLDLNKLEIDETQKIKQTS